VKRRAVATQRIQHTRRDQVDECARRLFRRVFVDDLVGDEIVKQAAFAERAARLGSKT
jgi:hypothetical protein